MSIIHDYIGSFNKKEHNCTKLINKCVKLSELQVYLDNLDAQARLEQTSSVILNHPAIEIIEKHNELLMTNLKDKIKLTIANSNIKNCDLIVFATRANSALGNDLDIVDMHNNQSTQAYKTYLVTKIILDILHHSQEQALVR